MKYDNTFVRRQDRLLACEEALTLLREGEYGVLSLCDADQPYGLPVNYVWDGASSLYVHCAPQGRKLRILAANPRASFCVVGRTRVLSRQFTTEYESLVACGTACPVEDEGEVRRALTLLIEKYSPQDRETGLVYLEKSLFRTRVLRLDMDTLSGKSKRMKKTTGIE